MFYYLQCLLVLSIIYGKWNASLLFKKENTFFFLRKQFTDYRDRSPAMSKYNNKTSLKWYIVRYDNILYDINYNYYIGYLQLFIMLYYYNCIFYFAVNIWWLW